MANRYFREAARQDAQAAKQQRVQEAAGVKDPLRRLWIDNLWRDIKGAYSPISPTDNFSEVYDRTSIFFYDIFFRSKDNSDELTATKYGTAIDAFWKAGLVTEAFGGMLSLGENILNTHTSFSTPVLLEGLAPLGICAALFVLAGGCILGLPLVPATISSVFTDVPRSIARTATQVVEHMRFDNGVPRSKRRNTN